MGFPIHTLEVVNGSNNKLQDRIVAGLLSGAASPASANAVTSLGSITAGTGFTGISTITLAATGGTGSGLTAMPTSIKAVSATLGAGGTGYAVNDTISLGNGVVITVNTVSSGVISTFTLTNGGSATVAPSNPVAQVSTSGSGTGATFNLAWGLGTVQITNSGNYTVAPSMTVTDTGGGTGASIAQGTLGGNGNGLYVAVAFSLPSSYGVQVTPGMDCRASVPSVTKTTTGFTVELIPPTSSSTLTAGTFDVMVLA